jgi:acetolactate synthase-1/2/3 large subunit
MVQCLRDLQYDYVAAMPGSTFRGLQESVINYLGNSRPEWITCVHEEISGALAHGYAKASGKPMAIMVHNTVGLQHASMAIYQAWADRVPMLVMLGNYADAAMRTAGAEWYHSEVDNATMVRGYIKYDDQPGSVQHFAESIRRGHGLMTTPPMGPALIVADQTLQEVPLNYKPVSRPFVPVSPPSADANAIEAVAKLLVGAQAPVIVVDRAARTPAGVRSLIALAELLQAPVVDRHGRMNFPTNHYLNGSDAQIERADVILALEVGDLYSVVNFIVDDIARTSRRVARADAKVIAIDSQLLAAGGNYQDKQRFYQADLPIGGDAEATLPALIEAVQRAMPVARRNDNAQREATQREAFHLKRTTAIAQAAVGWDAVPISIPRLVMEVWDQIKHSEDWALVSQATFQSFWQHRLWDFTAHHQYLGPQGAAGIGYTGPAAVGAALAHRSDGCLCVNIQGDGDFMVAPGALWTAAHHRLPLLTIIHNNRAWHQETMYVQKVAGRRDRHPERGRIGTVITDPNIDYAKLAQGQGVWAEGPITEPGDLRGALQRAIKVVKSGYPALLDVVTQPR